MKRGTFVVLMAVMTPAQAVLFGLLTGNPNWPWNIPLGLAVGYCAGVVLWLPLRRFQQWMDKKDAEREARNGR